jgi:hypothetical protein
MTFPCVWKRGGESGIYSSRFALLVVSGWKAVREDYGSGIPCLPLMREIRCLFVDAERRWHRVGGTERRRDDHLLLFVLGLIGYAGWRCVISWALPICLFRVRSAAVRELLCVDGLRRVQFFWPAFVDFIIRHGQPHSGEEYMRRYRKIRSHAIVNASSKQLRIARCTHGQTLL